MIKKVNRIFTRLLACNSIWFLIVIILINLAIFLANNQWVITKSVYYNSLIEKLSVERIDSIIRENHTWHLLALLFIPLVLLCKIAFTAACLYIGLTFAGLKNSFSDVFNIALKAEALFVFANGVRFILNLIPHRIEVFEDLNNYPLSLISITGTKGLYTWLIYPLQTLNLFELAYWFVLAWGLIIKTGKDFPSMVILVLKSYVAGLILWIMVVMLLTMRFSN